MATTALNAMTDLQKVVISKMKFKDVDIQPGTYSFDMTVRIQGTVDRLPDTEKKATCKIPYLTAMALLVRRMGLQRDAAIDVLMEVMQESMKMSEGEEGEEESDGAPSAEELLLEMTGVAEAKQKLETAIKSLGKIPAKGKCTVHAMVSEADAEDILELVEKTA